MVMLAGCSPRVTSDVMLSLPPRAADAVMLYENGDSIPATAQPIGTVKVTDGGMTPSYNCLYGNMLALAVKRTAECGGNALHIDKHKEPSVWTSSCHRIWGTMYLMSDSTVSDDAATALQKIEMNHDAELAEMSRHQIQNVNQLRNNPSNIFKVSAGPTWMTSEVETSKGVYKNKSGFELGIDYEHLWRWGFGLGLNYSYFATSFDEGFSIRMHYIGPSLVYSIMWGQKIRYEIGIGMGYAYYKESGNTLYRYTATESQLGMLGQIGMEYKLSNHVGLGLQVNASTIKMDKPEGYDMDKNEFYGIKRLATLLGLRFYL